MKVYLVMVDDNGQGAEVDEIFSTESGAWSYINRRVEEGYVDRIEVFSIETWEVQQ